MRCTSLRVLPLAFLGIALFSHSAESQENASRFSFGLEASVRYDDNIGFSPDNGIEINLRGEDPTRFDGDKFNDVTTRFAFSVNFAAVQNETQELQFSLTPFYEGVSDIGNLSRSGITVGAAYRGAFGSGFTDPWYSVLVDYTTAEFDDSRVRDGDWLEAEVAIGKRFSPRFGLSGGLRYFTRSQDKTSALCPNRNNGPECPDSWSSEEVFDIDKTGLFLHADLFVGSNTGFFLEYSYWEGDETSTADFVFNNPPDLVPADLVFADDPAFPPAFVTVGGARRDLKVWRIDADQHIFELGVSQQFTDVIGMSFSLFHLETDNVRAPNSNIPFDNYRNDGAELSLTVNF